jgi:hypothetical protein
MADIKPILAAWAEKVIEAAQRNLGATQSVKETNASGTKMKKRRRVASGNLKSSLTFFIRKGGGNTKLIFTAKGSAKNYADVIEKGRRPNSTPPPIEPIIQWMRTKPVRLQKSGGGFVKQTDAGIRSAAFLISRKIGRYGITGIHYMEDAVNDNLPELETDLQKYIETELNDGN